MRTSYIVAGTLVLFAALAVWRIEAASENVLTKQYAAPANPLGAPVDPGTAKLGERLAHLNGCFACHGKALTGQVAYRGMFGTVLSAPNLTHHVREHTDAQLATMIRYGIDEDGTTMIGMPSFHFIKSSDSDIAAIIAYLRTLTEEPATAPETHWGFGGRVMLATRLFPPEAEIVNPKSRGPHVTPTETIPLGKYIADSQCTICHGPDLSGDPEEHSPDLRVVLKHYTLAKFQHFLTTGEGRPGHDTKIMAEIIKRRLHFLTPTESAALYAYLKVPAPHGQN